MIELKARLKDISKDFRSGKFNLTFELDQLLPNMADAIADVCLRLSIKKWKEKRSLDANALFWHCVGELANAMRIDKWAVYLWLLKDYGQFTYVCVHPKAVEAVKRQWREVEEIGEVNINGTIATQLLCYYGSSTYDVEEFSRLLDGTMQEMRNIGIPTPADEQIERSLKEWERKYGNQHQASTNTK